MIITKSQLKQIIKEEIGASLREGFLDREGEEERHTFGLRTPDDKKAFNAGYNAGVDKAQEQGFDLERLKGDQLGDLLKDLSRKKLLTITDKDGKVKSVTLKISQSNPYQLTNAVIGFRDGYRTQKAK